jgi:RNA polymerase sigma-70 factor (ECF subfamily)
MSLLSLFRKNKTEDHFIALLRPHVEYLYRMAFRFCGSREDAEDLVQDVLLKLYPRTGQLAEVDNLRSWLTTVLYRQFIDRTRHVNRSPVQLADCDEQIDSPDNPGAGPERVTEQEHEIDQVQAALSRLNEDQRILVVLHDIEGYRLTELQQMLHVPLGTLKSRLHRARGQLKKFLNDAE